MDLLATAPIWVGELERRAVVADLAVASTYVAARLLVTAGGLPVGLVTVSLTDGRATAAAMLRAVGEQVGPDVHPVADCVAGDPAAAGRVAGTDEPLTVVITTRDRPASLRRSIRGVVAGDHPAVTVLVVDNDPPDDATAAVVREFADQDVVYVREPRRGLSVGRNRGLAEAGTALVAFTDDDTEADPGWARRLAGALAADPQLACVSGAVFAARLDTAEELAAERALVWNRGFTARRYSLLEPPPDSSIFPFSPGLFGIGANFAVRLAAARDVGGFDEALGAGAPARGGEDCEFMVRLVLAGRVVGYDPAPYVWHHHRTSTAALHSQMRGYAMGLGAFLAKVALDPRAATMAARRLPAALTHLHHIGEREATAGSGVAAGTAGERLSWMLDGGSAYVRGRRAARRAGGTVPRLTPHF